MATGLSPSMPRTRQIGAVFKLPVEQQIEHKHIVASQEFVDNLLKKHEKTGGGVKRRFNKRVLRKKRLNRVIWCGLIKTKPNTQ